MTEAEEYLNFVEGDCRMVSVQEGAVLEATIQPAKVPLETYQVKVTSVGSEEFVIEEVEEPTRQLKLPIDDVEQNGCFRALKLRDPFFTTHLGSPGDFEEISSVG